MSVRPGTIEEGPHWDARHYFRDRKKHSRYGEYCYLRDETRLGDGHLADTTLAEIVVSATYATTLNEFADDLGFPLTLSRQLIECLSLGDELQGDTNG